jgi:iron complex outermembrane receptor protein
MTQKRKTRNSARHAVAVLPTLAFSVGMTIPAQVVYATTADPSEIVVTARRTEEVIQNVPISMTVFNQEMLNERNVTNAADLVTYTPSLNVNSRFGSDQASFSIRGFTQDLATSASVAVYFADVVAPRAGGGSITGGDGAGPGAFFDLQNVQVLKGPQGTLFGRNTTGGAISLVPQEPTTKLEGYLELSRGNYDMSRAQGVLNVPISDTVRARFGFDTERRDGYLHNITDIGPDNFANIDYWSGRASVIWDVTDSLQNYTIGMYTHSKNNGVLQKLLGCGSGLFAFNCNQTQALPGAGGFYSVANGDYENPEASLKQWQIINTTTWNINDELTAKNILSYASLDQRMIGSLFGGDFSYPGLGKFVTFPSFPVPGLDSNNQSTWVDEIQFSGTALNDKLTWQGGYYYEDSRPNDWTGSISPSTISCPNGIGSNPSAWQCADVVGFAVSNGLQIQNPADYIHIGNIGYNTAHQEFNNQAIYSQGTYDISDEWRATLGLRYTLDNTHADYNRVEYADFPFLVPGGPALAFCNNGTPTIIGSKQANCLHHESQRSEAPTWLFDVDYLPTPDVMIYAKYSRGYRQGNIVPPAPPGFQSYGPEKVDAYEIGAKTSFHGPVPGTFNVAVFYNELSDQQLQMGFVPNPQTLGTGTTAIVNGGSSTIQGAEVETTLKLFRDLTFNLGYTYLDTHVDSITVPSLAGWTVAPSVLEGGHLTFSPRHTATTGLSYRVPLPTEIGDVSLGATYTFTSDQLSTTGSPFADLSARQLLNLSAGWKAIYGSGFDASFFMTNALNKQYVTYVSGLYESVGAEFGTVGEPRMWGARLKYNF